MYSQSWNCGWNLVLFFEVTEASALERRFIEIDAKNINLQSDERNIRMFSVYFIDKEFGIKWPSFVYLRGAQYAQLFVNTDKI